MSIYYIHQSRPQEHLFHNLGRAEDIFHFQDREGGHEDLVVVEEKQNKSVKGYKKIKKNQKIDHEIENLNNLTIETKIKLDYRVN